MRRSVAFLSTFVGVALLAGAACAADEKKCTLGKIGEFQITMQGAQGMVAAKINGVETNLMVDSGAFFSSLDSSARERFGLKRGVMPPGMTVTGVGGMANVSVGRADTFEVGNFKMTGIEFLVGGPTFGSRAAGILGQNVLSGADVEYDFANGVVRMFDPHGCDKANLAYWAGDKPYSVIAMSRFSDTGLHIVGTAKVNGQTVRVVFDTGASTSVMKKGAAERVGFRADGPGVVAGGLSGGFGDGVRENWIAPFASFEIGGEKITNTRLRVANITLNDADMLLGADFFLSHRIYVAKSQDKIFITYNGGPIFRLGPPTRPTNQAEALPPGGAGQLVADTAPQGPPGAAPAEPSDADGYARRAAASAARRDYAGAVADLTKAISLKPQADYYFQRAAAHQAARQPLMAIADYDETLKLKPDHVPALVSRGEIFLNNRNIPRAKSDFEAAVKMADASDDIGVRIGGDYLRAGLVDEAIAEYTAWLNAHPRDDRNAAILNGRCYARALGNKELDLALADCNAAIRGSANSASLDSRGFVYLRMGQYDKAIDDFESALKRQPRAANPMYGRGLAKAKKGQATEGRADMQAALALDPTLARRAQQFGLVE